MYLPIPAWEWVEVSPWDPVLEWAEVWVREWVEVWAVAWAGEWVEVWVVAWVREWDMAHNPKLHLHLPQLRTCPR